MQILQLRPSTKGGLNMDEFEETLTIDVVTPNERDNDRLTFKCEGDVIDVIIDGEVVCSCDWTANFEPAIKRMLEMWGNKPVE